jgi:1,4-alpha-glucan branching enzyme
MTDTRTARAYSRSWGAELDETGARFRLWAPGQDAVTLRLDGRDHPMAREEGGWYSTDVAGARAGAEYAFVMPDGLAVPDPAARAQAGDVHGPSLLVDPRAYRWRNDWPGRPWAEAVIMEIHIGTFTPEGTFRPPPSACRTWPRRASRRSRSCRSRSSAGTAAGAMTASCPTRRTGLTARPRTSRR